MPIDLGEENRLLAFAWNIPEFTEQAIEAIVKGRDPSRVIRQTKIRHQRAGTDSSRGDVGAIGYCSAGGGEGRRVDIALPYVRGSGLKAIRCAVDRVRRGQSGQRRGKKRFGSAGDCGSREVPVEAVESEVPEQFIFDDWPADAKAIDLASVCW